jgi:hypothetical protein
MGNAIDLKFDWIRGGKSSFPLPMGASVTIYPQSGKFVDMSGGYGALATASSTYLTGWVECGKWDHTANAEGAAWKASATAGAQLLDCIRDLTAVFRMPLAYLTATYTTNYADTLIGYLRDIYTSTYQYADLTNGTDDFLVVVGGRAATAAVAAGAVGDGYVDVMMNPATALGV